MEDKYKWQYDEMKQIGTDYENEDEIIRYDERMAKLRDVNKEINDIIESTGLDEGHTMVEFGCGTGELAIAAAGICRKVIAVDISEPMVQFARKKAEDRVSRGINFVCSGFLNYEHQGEPADVIVSQLALHHLPDFWKMAALKKIHGILKIGGRFYLRDVVFSIPPDKYEQKIEGFLSYTAESAGEENASNYARHIKDEYSTYDWIMEEMLYRAGFYLERADYGEGMIAAYVCMKTEEFKI